MPAPARLLRVATLLLLCVAVRVPAQEIAEDALDERSASNSASVGPFGVVPVSRGFNTSITIAPEHDSSAGWRTLFLPIAAYRCSPVFSLTAALPIYSTIRVQEQIGTLRKPRYVQKTVRGALGDLSLSASANYPFKRLYGTFTTTLGLPTGRSKYGLGAGQVTYNLNNHVEAALRRLSPDLEIGIGDTSSLTRERLPRDYTSVGHLLHVQAGASLLLPRNALFSAQAYEEMPLGYNTVYSTTTRGKKKVTTSVTSPTAAEDNGLQTTLDIPVLRHVTLSGFYNRSIRSHADLAGFSFTLLLRTPHTLDELLEP